MILSIYLILVLLAFLFLIIAMYVGSYTDKIGTAILFILISMVLFSIVALNSLSITKTFCGA